jgi:hypothetical protein
MDNSDLQVRLFQHIKNKLSPQVSLVDDMAKLLDISTDSAYRRIRGEKALSLEEVCKLCTHFKLSLDSLLNLQGDAYLFAGSFIQPESFRFDQYLKTVAQQVNYMRSFREKKMYYLCKDIPLFHHFHFREVAAFKHYVWMKGIFNSPELSGKRFSLKDYPDEMFQLGQKALEIYNEIDSVEIWNLESINSTMRQIDYYHDSGLFENEEEVIVIYEAVEKLMAHLNRQASQGYKSKIDDAVPGDKGKFEMYLNEMVIGDNSVLALLDGSKISFIIHTVINIMTTTDTRFCDNMYESLQNLIKRSTLISTVSERERSRFFKHLRQRIANRKQSLST